MSSVDDVSSPDGTASQDEIEVGDRDGRQVEAEPVEAGQVNEIAVRLPAANPPAWLPKAILYVLLGAAAFLITWNLVRSLQSLLVMLLMAGFVSFAVEPAVNRLEDRGWQRGRATAFSFLALFVMVSLFIGIMVNLLVEQVTALVKALPGYLDQAAEWINATFNANLSTETINEQLIEYQDDLSRIAADVGGRALSISAAVVGVIFQMFTVGLFSFYLVADGPRFRRSICSVLPPKRQRLVLTLWELAINKTGGYIYSRMTLAMLSGGCTWVVLAILDVPSPLALALWVGLVSQFVPVIGTYLAGVFPVLVALLNDPLDAVLVLGFIVIYQQIENYVFSPRITARTMEIHPAVAFGAVIAGASILGGIGGLLALPVAAVIQAFVTSYVHRHEVVQSVLTGVAAEPVPPGETKIGMLERIQKSIRGGAAD